MKTYNLFGLLLLSAVAWGKPMNINDIEYYDSLQLVNIQYRAGNDTFGAVINNTCVVTLNDTIKPTSLNTKDQTLWNDFARSHEVAHCAFPEKWNEWKKRYVLDEKFYHPFFQRIEESYADAYAIAFIKKKYPLQAQQFLKKIQTWRSEAHDYHGNALVFNEDYNHLSLMEKAISSAFDSTSMDRTSIRNNNSFELIHALALYKLQEKLGHEGMKDVNSVSAAYYWLETQKLWPKNLLTFNTQTKTYSVNQNVLRQWKKTIEKQSWYIHQNNVFIKEKEDIWNELSEYVYHNEKAP